MPRPITVNKDSEFYIAIAKEGVHSFLMSGVMMDGKAIPLARVGKSNLIDPSFGTGFRDQLRMFGKVAGSHSQAMLMDEGIEEEPDYNPNISYQAYSITYEQYLEFLRMIKEVHEQQLQYYKDRVLPDKNYKELSFPEKGLYKLRSGLKCYIPEESSSGQVKLAYKAVQQYQPSELPDQEHVRQHIVSDASEIRIANTCRTTARSILDYVLGYSPDVPALFAIGLDYVTKLSAGKPTTHTFYVLPQPPKCFEAEPAKMSALKELYKKIENIPKIQPESDTTRKKFDELKHLYLELAGKPQLGLMEVLDIITVHRAANNELFDKHRGEGLVRSFAELLKLRTGTQAAYDRMEKAIKKEIERINPDSSIKSRKLVSDDNRPPHATEVFSRKK